MSETKTKISIVEDENIIAKDIKRTVEKLGYEVTGIFSKGEEVLLHLNEFQPDLVLMDIMLKGELSGIETAKKVYDKYKIPIVYLTALTDEETLQKAKITEPFGFLLKPFDQRELHTAIEIALYKHKMEMDLKRRTLELEEEKKKTDELLHHILPSGIVKELRIKGEIIPRHHENVSIMFTEFHEYSQISSNLAPDDLVNELNEIFVKFDDIMDEFGLEKLKTIGDIYMVAGGLPEKNKNHAVVVIDAALEMHEFLLRRNKISKIKWQMRTGVNSGPVVAGIVGTNKFTYDVWGDTVNIASRMETNSLPGRINISSYTYELIKDSFICEYRGKLNAKGKGEIDMYFVDGKKEA